MSPSNRTVCRFIATYGRGFDELVQRVILGFGYQDEGGKTHQDLLYLYLGRGRDYTDKLYAGYFTVENGNLQIFSGGSQTLCIPSSRERDRKLMDDLDRHRELKRAVVDMFPLITAGSVYHAMLAP